MTQQQLIIEKSRSLQNVSRELDSISALLSEVGMSKMAEKVGKSSAKILNAEKAIREKVSVLPFREISPKEIQEIIVKALDSYSGNGRKRTKHKSNSIIAKPPILQKGKMYVITERDFRSGRHINTAIKTKKTLDLQLPPRKVEEALCTSCTVDRFIKWLAENQYIEIMPCKELVIDRVIHGFDIEAINALREPIEK